MDQKVNYPRKTTHFTMNNHSKRTILYVHLDKNDEKIQVSDLGIAIQDMMCGLMTVHGKIKLAGSPEDLKKKRLFLCSDICMVESVVSGGQNLPILRELKLDNDSVNMDISNVLWLDARDQLLQTVRLFIKDENDKIASLDECFLKCTLLLFPK